MFGPPIAGASHGRDTWPARARPLSHPVATCENARSACYGQQLVTRPTTRLRLHPGQFLLAAVLAMGCSDPYGTPPDVAKPAGPPRSATAPDHGFGDNIPWEPFDQALAHAKTEKMPVMLVVHASWCKRCKELKPTFFEDEVAALSQHFVMVNVDQDREPRSLQYAPDGDYIPRVVFIDPTTGKTDASLLNPGRRSHRYFYTPSDTDDLLAVMKRALSAHERT